MVAVTTPVENHLPNTRCLSSFGHHLTHQPGLLSLAQSIQARQQVWIQRGGRGNRMPLLIVNDLSTDLLQTAKDVQAWTVRGTEDLLTYTPVAPPAGHRPGLFSHCDLVLHPTNNLHQEPCGVVLPLPVHSRATNEAPPQALGRHYMTLPALPALRRTCSPA